MANQDWSDLGDRIKYIVQDAIDSQNFNKLNQSINDTIRTMGDTIKHAAKDSFGNASPHFPYGDRTAEKSTQEKERTTANKTQTSAPKPPARQLTVKPGKASGGSLALTIIGSVFSGVFGGMSLLALAGLLSGLPLLGTTIPTLGLIMFTPFLITGISMLAIGLKKGARAKRFKLYLSALKQKTYCNLSQLERLTGKSHKFVLKDIHNMIQRGWFFEGHLDEQGTCLMTSNETYEEYLKTINYQKEEYRRKQEAEQVHAQMPQDVRSIIETGNVFIDNIRKSNDAIPGEAISQKISRMETIVRKIFERVEQDPEVIPDLRKLMEYYLPTTIKLLDAYEDLGNQPVQGENILAAKLEIEKTLDTLNVAFEKLLDSLFKDIAWDVSSDISVLHTMLAQEGLTGNDFNK